MQLDVGNEPYLLQQKPHSYCHYRKPKNTVEFWYSTELLSSLNFGPMTDRQTESDAYEPTVLLAQVGSKMAF